MHYEHENGFSDDMLGDEEDDTSFDDNIFDETEEDTSQYFPVADQNKLIETAMAIYQNSLNTAYLAIILTFCLGLRIGELVGLKVSDFDFEAGIVRIQRQEVYKFKNGKKCGVRISRKMKTANSNRKIPISPFCKKIFEMVVEDNERRGLDSDYLFNALTTGERMHASSVDKALNIANGEAGLTQRSVHKIRKTVLSRLNMSLNFTLERIREIAGHSRQSVVLYTNYFYHIDGLDGITDCKTFEEVVDFMMPDPFREAEHASDKAEEPPADVSEPEEQERNPYGVIPFKQAV